MEWTDDGIVLGVRRHGESSAIVELLTRGHGRHLGLVRGGSASRMRPVLQPGNSVRAVWRARLDEHLGTYAVEGTRLRAESLLASAQAGGNGWSDQDLQDGFRLTGLFLLRHVLEPRGQGLSDAREGFINAVTRRRARVGSI